MLTPLIEAKNIEVKIGSKVVLHDISFTIGEREAWAITGPAGSGKTTLAKAIQNHYSISSGSVLNHLSPNARIVMVDQQHTYRNRTDASATYYQARFESLSSEDFPVVEEALKEHFLKAGRDKPVDEAIEKVLALLQITYLRQARLIQLSNGENKRFQLAKALLQEPKVLILDNPFVGLDQEAREILHEIINQLIKQEITIILITAPTEIPEQITHVIELQAGHLAHLASRASFLQRPQIQQESPITESWLKQEVLETMPIVPDESFEIAVRMQDVSVRYGERTILDGVNWQVNRGDKWALSGPNGAGKSTLLSLIYGDNLQAYANTIHLFDQRRGTGESIWDIKRRIGYISPELHLYFNRSLSCFNAIASGLTDTMVGNKHLSDEQKATVTRWLDIFHLTHHSNESLADLPLSEQRLILLARALVKNPPVLLLDEPCQGLDAQQTQRFTTMVDAICRHFDKTLIYVSHYSQDIPACVNQRLFLKEGKATITSVTS
uniref:ATP-binding cassette domain-containing protein n=1 Tax=Roseihalotalea indica TaxID=2867963 RepID=A0AA49JHV4_9BACT|nr:ATP-binding cassette domain-containing protein [Tunicatimonas sp. TK19036]